ncbi:HD domain-containing protein [Candidatus Poribacteria bacterium]|nr:HD domain-containing protein [Candidatus Poribacteria bacterium]
MRNNSDEKRCNTVKELRATFLNHIAQRFDERSFKPIHRALKLAEDAHAGQTRDDDTPYILHPLRVALSLMQELDGYDAELLCAALLHDVAEDHERFTSDFLEAEFGSRVGSIVRTLTKPKASEKTREQINELYFERLWGSDEDCKLIKLIDKLDNVRDAINCPYPDNRQRTASEAREFYLSLAESLRDTRHRRIVLNLMNEAIDMLSMSVSRPPIRRQVIAQ